jgi:myo-inositol-1(or 4)-monophosphatase
VSASSWLPTFRGIAADIRAQVAPLCGTSRGRRVVGTGAGGDRTVFLDAFAEGIAVRHLEEAYRSGLRFRLLSEELGAGDYGGDPLVLLDPIDGSLNAKQGVPYYAVLLALASGDRLADVEIALVLNLATGDEFVAERGGGAFQNGLLIRSQGEPLPARYPLVQLDVPDPLAGIQRVRAIIAHAERLRVLGSVGLNLCHTATGALSLTLAPVPVRAFDLAGPLLILREAGGIATDLDGGSLDAVTTGLTSKTTLLAAASRAAHERALELLAGG